MQFSTATQDVVGRALRLQPGGSPILSARGGRPQAARLPYNDFFLIRRGFLRRPGTVDVALATKTMWPTPIWSGRCRIGDLTNPRAQGSSVVLQTHPTAGEKVRDGRDRFSVATRAGTDCQDKVAQRQTRKFSRFQNLSISFHTIASVWGSNFNTISVCEYLIHKPYAVIHLLCTV